MSLPCINEVEAPLRSGQCGRLRGVVDVPSDHGSLFVASLTFASISV